MYVPFFIARRYLFRAHKIGFISFISYFSVIGLAIGITALCLTLFVLKGFEREIKKKIIAFDAHIRLTMIDQGMIFEYKLIQDRLDSIPGVRAVHPFIETQGMIRAGKNTDGVILMGLTPEGFKTTLGVEQFIVVGKFDTTRKDGLSPLLIGRRLADNLEVNSGDPVVIYDLSGSIQKRRIPRLKRFYIAGIYETGMADYEDIFVYTDLKSAAEFLKRSFSVTGFNIAVSNPGEAGQISSKITDLLGFPYFPLTWEERHVNLLKWLKIQKFPILMVFGLILMVAVFNVVSSLTMIVMEKERNISILRSLGFSVNGIQRIFLLQGFLIGLIGSSMGILLSLLLAFLQIKFGFIHLPADVYYMDKVPILIEARELILIWLMGILLSILATFYPSRRAARLKPAEVLRYE